MPSAPRSARVSGAMTAAALLFGANAARAQSPTATPLERFEPAPAGDAFFSTPSADVTSALRPGVALGWSYAHDPLVVVGQQTGQRDVVVSYQATMHVLLSLELAKRLKLDMDIPGTLAQGGSPGGVGQVQLKAVPGAEINDLRLGLRGVLLRQDGYFPAAAVGLTVWAPTGQDTAYTGSGSARIAPFVVVGADYGRWLWSANFARRFQTGPENANNLIGSEVMGGAALALRIASFQIGPEVFASTSVDDHVLPDQVRTGGAEAMLAGRYYVGPFTAGVGAGGGLGTGPGTPGYRLFAELSFAPVLATSVEVLTKPPWEHRDEPAPVVVAPPPPPPKAVVVDTDGDGVPDAEDLCPTVVGDPSPTAKRRGCPPDRDGDGIPDADDRCPDEPGVESADPAKNGCPLDSDGDGIPDMDDACPHEPGRPTKDIKTNGCPAQVRLEGKQIVILEQVHFATGRDEIQKDSFGLLGQVAAVIQGHPEIARIAVDGHTDNVGGEKGNLTLSEKRAVSVMKWLTDHGVDARRLESRGFGPRRPIADNKKEEGRAKNRRVEFQILLRTPEGEAGWIDGPIK